MGPHPLCSGTCFLWGGVPNNLYLEHSPGAAVDISEVWIVCLLTSPTSLQLTSLRSPLRTQNLYVLSPPPLFKPTLGYPLGGNRITRTKVKNTASSDSFVLTKTMAGFTPHRRRGVMYNFSTLWLVDGLGLN